MNVEENTQSFFDLHTDDIISMACNESRTEIFTG